MGNINSYNPIISTRRKGTMDDPYINIEESFVVKDNKVLLSEIPSEKDHVNAIDVDNNELYYEIYDGIPDEREFIVDYRFGIITFHPYANDKNIKFTYVGTGNYYLPAKRVWTKQNNGMVEETLGDIIESGKEVIEILPQVEIITNNAIAATENANNVATLISNAEEDRVIAETNRVNAENLRIVNENERQSQEAIRLSQEAERVNKENLRITAEDERINAESTRISNESIRQSQEETRQNNELIRQSNEIDRQTRDAEFQVWEEYNPEKLYRPLNKVVYQGSSFLCKQQCQGVSPSDANYWLKIASAGAGTLVEDSDINGNIKINSSETIVYRHPDTHPASIITINDDNEYFESTNVEDALQEIASEIKTPRYSVPQEATSSIITLPDYVAEGQFSDIVLKGNSVTQIIKNGNFTNEITNWSVVGGTLSVAGNIMSVTGNGTNASPVLIQNTLLKGMKGKRIFLRAKAKVTNSECINISFYVSSTGITAQTVKTYVAPNQNTEYVLFGVVTLSNEFTIDKDLYVYVQHTYSNAAASNGKVMEVKEVMAIDMGTSASDNLLYNLTADEMNQRFPNWLPYGVVSTESVRITATNKNLFGSKYAADKIVNTVKNKSYAYKTVVDGRNCVAIVGAGVVAQKVIFEKFRPNTQYTIQVFGKRAVSSDNGGIFQIKYTDGTSDFVEPYNDMWTKITFTSRAGKTISGIYLTYSKSNAVNYYDYDTFQLEENTTATEYEPCIRSEAYIDEVGGSLPNGVFDEVSVITGEKKKKISNDVVINGNMNWTLDTSDTTGTTVWVEINSILTNYIATESSGSATYGENADMIFSSNIPSGNVGRLVFVKNVGTGKDRLYVKLPLYSTTLQSVKDYLNQKPITLIYQLATPIVSEYPYSKLMAYPNGHLIVEPVVFDVGYYSGGIQVEKTHLPIKSLDYVAKIDVDTGALTYIDLTKCTVAADGLSFTITDANNTEYYEYAYYYDSSLTTLPTVKYSYPMNTVAAIDGNTKAIAKISNDLGKTAKMVMAHIEDEIPHIYKDRNTTAEYRLVVIDGRPYLEVVKV